MIIRRKQAYHCRQCFQYIKEAFTFFLQCPFCAFAFGNISGRGKDARNISSGIFINYGIVKNIHAFAAFMLERQRIVGNESLLEYLLVPFPGFVWFCEAVRKISPDKFFSGDSCGFYCSFIDIGNLAFFADG